MSALTWKEKLSGDMPPKWGEEIDEFEAQIRLRKAGKQRIKIPFGGLNPEQMIVLAELAEEYSDAICHITTRQDIQLHFVHIEETPTIFRRLAAVEITTREACGNS